MASEVRERLDQQTDAHDVAQAEASFSAAVREHADHAARRHCRGQEPADLGHAQPLGGVQDEHPHAAP